MGRRTIVGAIALVAWTLPSAADDARSPSPTQTPPAPRARSATPNAVPLPATAPSSQLPSATTAPRMPPIVTPSALQQSLSRASGLCKDGCPVTLRITVSEGDRLAIKAQGAELPPMEIDYYNAQGISSKIYCRLEDGECTVRAQLNTELRIFPWPAYYWMKWSDACANGLPQMCKLNVMGSTLASVHFLPKPAEKPVLAIVSVKIDFTLLPSYAKVLGMQGISSSAGATISGNFGGSHKFSCTASPTSPCVLMLEKSTDTISLDATSNDPVLEVWGWNGYCESSGKLGSQLQGSHCNSHWILPAYPSNLKWTVDIIRKLVKLEVGQEGTPGVLQRVDTFVGDQLQLTCNDYCSDNTYAGIPVTLKAFSAPGYKFKWWSSGSAKANCIGPLEGGGNPTCTIATTGDYQVVAHFEKN